jgi:hypothetical protein
MQTILLLISQLTHLTSPKLFNQMKDIEHREEFLQQIVSILREESLLQIVSGIYYPNVIQVSQQPVAHARQR